MIDAYTSNLIEAYLRNKSLEPRIPDPAIPFNQTIDIRLKLDDTSTNELLQIYRKYKGLCELICNRILIDNSLGSNKPEDSLQNKVTVKRLDNETIKKSHLLMIHSIFTKATAYLFAIYPDNIFSYSDQWSLVNKASPGKSSVNRKMLEKGLSTIAPGTSLKLQVIIRDFLGFSGHSMLIKKLADENYILFDPNAGEYRNLSLDKVSDIIDQQLSTFEATDIYLTKGECFLKRLQTTLGIEIHQQSSDVNEESPAPSLQLNEV